MAVQAAQGRLKILQAAAAAPADIPGTVGTAQQAVEVQDQEAVAVRAAGVARFTTPHLTTLFSSLLAAVVVWVFWAKGAMGAEALLAGLLEALLGVAAVAQVGQPAAA
jgi:hypothetical protein